MKNLEVNKIVAAVVIAGIFALGSGKIADIFYQPEFEIATRGFQVEVANAATGNTKAAKKEEVLDIPALMAVADATVGKKTFKKCAACHSATEGGSHKVGPLLYKVFGSKVAGHADYNYSGALKEKGGNWDYDQLFAFLKKPKKFAPGTKMTFAGLKKPKDIANIIAYLQSTGK